METSSINIKKPNPIPIIIPATVGPAISLRFSFGRFDRVTNPVSIKNNCARIWIATIIEIIFRKRSCADLAIAAVTKNTIGFSMPPRIQTFAAAFGF